jgi:ribosomal protein L23
VHQVARSSSRQTATDAMSRSDWNKAIVTLQPDQKIELFEQI